MGTPETGDRARRRRCLLRDIRSRDVCPRLHEVVPSRVRPVRGSDFWLDKVGRPTHSGGLVRRWQVLVDAAGARRGRFFRPSVLRDDRPSLYLLVFAGWIIAG